MKHKETMFTRYPDLLDEQADAETWALIQQLDAIYTTPNAPAHLTLSRALAARASQADHAQPSRQKRLVPLARWFLPPRPLPQRLASIAIALLLALLLTVGSTYAVGTILDKVINFDPGAQQVKLENLYQPINQSRMIGDFTLTVEQGYADSNRVIIAFTVKKPAGHIYNHAEPKSVTLTTQDGLALPYYSGWGYGNREGDDAYTSFYDASGITGNPREVHLHLEAQGLDVYPEDDASTHASGAGPVSFDFSLTFHPGRVADVHQTVTAGGMAVTLERVVVTLSETRVYLRGLAGQTVILRLSVDGWDSDHSAGLIGGVGGKNAAGDQTVIFFSDSLYDKHGQWTLTVKLNPTITNVSAPASGGPWTFHFVVP